MIYRLLVFVFLLSMLGACGKNAGVPYTAPSPIAQAPYGPGTYGPNGSPYPTPGSYNYPGSPSNYPYFNPQTPSGYPQAYYPFLPIDQYFRGNPAYTQYWTQFWNQWILYAGMNGRNPYDFRYFWLEYCPRMWLGTPYWEMYVYFNQTFYYWLTPTIVLAPAVDPIVFWGTYVGYSYVGISVYGF